MTVTRLNSLIGGTFGLLFVVLNAGTLTSTVAWTLRAAGIVVFLGLLVLVWRRDSESDGASRAEQADPYRNRGFRLVVAAEVAALVGGIALLNGPLHAPDAVLGWVSLVVGVHFLGLAIVWRTPFFNLLGAAITVCGVAGLIAAGVHASVATDAVIAGLIPGAILLAAAYAGTLGRTNRH